jgi:tripartite-type tricarboxylate transporter receptor subunit TctC
MPRRRATLVPRPIVLALGLLVLGLNCASASAQGFPGRPIRIIVPFAAGGAVDELARIIGARLGASFGQAVVVENHAGAGGNLGADLVAKS